MPHPRTRVALAEPFGFTDRRPSSNQPTKLLII
jgi:hypothetical protein